MRTLLTTLPSPFLDNDKAFPALGILYLLAAAKEAGRKIQYLRYPGDIAMHPGYDLYYTDSVTCNGDAYRSFDAVAISAVTPQGLAARKLLLLLKSYKPDRPVAIGGPHATHYGQECLDAGFDYVVAGDGEAAFLLLLEENLGCNYHQEFLSAAELNAFPPPLREKEYLQNYRAYTIAGRPATTMIASRGCANRCAFCEDAGTPARWYSPEHFERQVLDVKAAGFEAVMIYDDLFAVSAKKVAPYAEILQRHGVIYRCFTHARSICKNPALAPTLARTGCIAVGFGAENMDDGILDNINKRTTGEMNQECVDRCCAHGINVKSFFILGLPGETHETAQKIYDFVKLNREKHPKLYDFDTASIYFPFKGTEIGDSLRAGEDRFDLKLVDGLTWGEVDRRCLGAHKGSGGSSDHITETTELSSADLWAWQEELLGLSKRFKINRELKEGVYE